MYEGHSDFLSQENSAYLLIPWKGSFNGGNIQTVARILKPEDVESILFPDPERRHAYQMSVRHRIELEKAKEKAELAAKIEQHKLKEFGSEQEINEDSNLQPNAFDDQSVNTEINDYDSHQDAESDNSEEEEDIDETETDPLDENERQKYVDEFIEIMGYVKPMPKRKTRRGRKRKADDIPKTSRPGKRGRKPNNYRWTEEELAQKKFECDKCSYRTSRKSDLNKHARIHGGVRPYKCSICNRSFTQNSHLRVHFKVHNEGSKM